MSTTALRTSFVWRDEVMQDVVLERPDTVTIGTQRPRKLPRDAWFALPAILAACFGMYVSEAVPDLVVIGVLVISVLWWVSNTVMRWRESGVPTLFAPDLGLPPGFAIIRPGNRGYLLALSDRMRGTICIDGREKDVADLVAREGNGGFCATAIGGRDWGVIDLDPSGHYRIFFQFVGLDEAPQFFTRPVLIAGGAGYLVSSLALTVLWKLKGEELSEAIFRGLGIATVAILLGAVAWGVFRQEGESQASLAFSVVLHAALLFMTYQLYDGENPFVWPGPRQLSGNYLVTRLEKEEPPPPKPTPSTVGQAGAEAPAAASKTPPKKTATKGEIGQSGGKGETERARDANAKDVPPEAPKVQFFEDKNKKVLDNIIDRNLSTSLTKFAGIQGDTTRRGSLGFGAGAGTGVGLGTGTGTRSGVKGKGNGGGGGVDGDFVTGKGPIDTGGERPGGTCKGAGCNGTGPKPVQVAFNTPSGDFGGLTAEEINRVIQARAGVFRACYQKELNHTPGIGGKLMIHFKIGGDGAVQSGNTSTAAGSSLRNDAVESCIKNNINRLKFPAKGGIANVNYPFVFTQGG